MIPHGRFSSVTKRVLCGGIALLGVLLTGFHAARADVPAGIAGIVEPVRDVRLSAPVAGTILAVHFREGDRFSKDDVLVDLDGRLEELEVARRKLVLEDLSEQTAARERATVLERDLQSTLRLFDSTGSVSREDLDRKRLEHALAALELERITQTKARERIEYEMALEQQARRRIAAPFDGVVVDVFLDEGEGCQAQQPIIWLVDDRACWFTANVERSALGGVVTGQAATLLFEGPDQARREGTVSLISPMIDPASGLCKVKIQFENPPPRIQPGTVGWWLQGGNEP